MFAVEEEERAVEEEIEEDEEFEFKVVFDEEFELEVTFDEVEVVEFDVVFPEVDEPKRAVIGISVSSLRDCRGNSTALIRTISRKFRIS